MNLKYLKKLQPILNKVGKKHNIPVKEGEFIIDSFFRAFRDAITDPRIPKVKFPNFGTFMPKVKYIDRSLRMSVKFHQAGATTYEYLKARFERLWGIRERLIYESEGGVTWRDWYKKEMKEKFLNLVSNEQEERKKSTSAVYGSVDYAKKQKRVFENLRKRF